MADEVAELEERLNELVHEMREVCVLAGALEARRRADRRACCTSCPRSSAWATPRSTSVAIVTHRLGIPAALVADLAAAEEVSHRVRVRAGSQLDGPALEDVELPMDVGMRVVALRRGRDWLIDPDGDDLLLPDDVLILRGARDGIAELRELAGAPEWRRGRGARRTRRSPTSTGPSTCSSR